MKFILSSYPQKAASYLFPEDVSTVAHYVRDSLRDAHKSFSWKDDFDQWIAECSGNYYWACAFGKALTARGLPQSIYNDFVSLHFQHPPGQKGPVNTRPSTRVIEEARMFYATLRRVYAVDHGASAPGWLVRLAAIVPVTRLSATELFSPLSFRPGGPNDDGSYRSEWTEVLP